MTESVRRALADPFSLGADLVPWEPPAVPPDSATLRAARAELDRTLAPAPDGHVDWCLGKLFALPTRANTPEGSAYLAEGFLDVAGHYPADLWTWATKEILRTKKFRPAPAELVELIEPKFSERKRMLARVKAMLEPARPALPPKPPVPKETGLQRLENLREIYTRRQRPLDVERIDRLIAIAKGEAPAPLDQSGIEREPVDSGPYRPADTPMARRLAEITAAKRAASLTTKPAA